MSEQARILVIDDDEVIRLVFKANLERQGYIVDIAESAEDALRMIEREFYNLALIDIHLPNMKGTEILGKIEQMQPSMVKLLITGQPTIDSAIEALNKRADGYIMKPVDMEELFVKIERLLAEQDTEAKYTILRFFGVHVDNGKRYRETYSEPEPY